MHSRAGHEHNPREIPVACLSRPLGLLKGGVASGSLAVIRHAGNGDADPKTSHVALAIAAGDLNVAASDRHVSQT